MSEYIVYLLFLALTFYWGKVSYYTSVTKLLSDEHLTEFKNAQDEITPAWLSRDQTITYLGSLAFLGYGFFVFSFNILFFLGAGIIISTILKNTFFKQSKRQALEKILSGLSRNHTFLVLKGDTSRLAILEPILARLNEASKELK